jgi:hypothetical protein
MEKEEVARANYIKSQQTKVVEALSLNLFLKTEMRSKFEISRTHYVNSLSIKGWTGIY